MCRGTTAQEFIKKLNEKEKGKGWLYRLPTEAEWEYACRGGATSEEECSYHFYFAKPTNDLSSKQANFNGNFPFGKGEKGPYLERTTKVGSYAPNKLGLYDMHGNVWQWCADLYDPKDPASDRVSRGGGWCDDGGDCQAVCRYRVVLSRGTIFLGLRLARVPSSQAAEPPKPKDCSLSMVERYLHSGELAKGEQALLLALEKTPDDDQSRFGLGVLQFGRAVERLGQSLYEYGAEADNTKVPFLRLPVPKNDTPSTISYRAFGRILDVFVADLARAGVDLAKVKNTNVKLPLRLAYVRFDLTGEGKPTDKFLDVLIKMNGGRFEFLKYNPDLLVCFDRGDVAWLRQYRHLLSAAVEGYRAFDLEVEFDKRVRNVFPKVEPSLKKAVEGDFVLVVADAARLGRFRKHMLAVCELNRETWKFIRAETDNDHEWLPNPKQTAAIGLRVTNEMIDGWLEMIDQLEELLKGERLFPGAILGFVDIKTNGKGVNVKTLLDDPPPRLSQTKLKEDGIDGKYLEAEGKSLNFNVILRIYSMFNGPLTYMAWFN